jgi:transcription initiation factor TFIIIB Brf1 subunit/transcription initiation factor TFIIB
MGHSLDKSTFNRWHIAAACLFVACKVQEQPKKLVDFIQVYRNALVP